MKLIFVHGRSQEGKNPVNLQEKWENAFRKGLDAAGLTWPKDLRILFPFYGDKLDELVQKINAPLVADVTMKGAAKDSKEASFRGELLYEMATAYGIKDEDIQKHYSGKPQEKGPLNWEWVQSILKALDDTPLGEDILDAFTRDVYVYLNYDAVRKAIDNIVEEYLTQEPCILVGHSLGSVVGYNVMRKTQKRVNIKRYITVGSPLGLKSIKRILKPLAMPDCLNSWFNAMDERDVVALHPLNNEHFPIDPEIENKTDVNNHTDNRHGIEGYLDDPDVVRKIYEVV